MTTNIAECIGGRVAAEILDDGGSNTNHLLDAVHTHIGIGVCMVDDRLRYVEVGRVECGLRRVTTLSFLEYLIYFDVNIVRTPKQSSDELCFDVDSSNLLTHLFSRWQKHALPLYLVSYCVNSRLSGNTNSQGDKRRYAAIRRCLVWNTHRGEGIKNSTISTLACFFW